MIDTNSLIDANAIEILVKDKVAEIIVAEVDHILTNSNTLHTAIRRDASTELVKQLVPMYDDIDIESMVSDYISNNIRIDDSVIATAIREQITAPTSKLLETESVSKLIEQQVVNLFVKRLAVQLNSINIEKMVADKVDNLFNDHVKNTEYTGLVDKAKKTELTILDDTVVVENEFVARTIKSMGNVDANGTLTVKKNFILHGDINVDARGWVKLSSNIERNVLKNFKEQITEELKKSVLEHAKTEVIDFSSVTINGKELIEDNALNKSIVKSNLKKVGQLDNLNVKGEAEIHDTLFVGNKRIGINTTLPSMALAVWDEEVELIAGKSKNQTAFIGTNRKQALEIGINRKAEITVQDDGLVVINRLRLGKNMLSYDTSLPGYLGGKGDMVFNVNISPGNPIFAWVCIGGHKWMPLKAIV